MTKEQHDISDKLNEDKSLEQPERQNLIQKTAAQQEKLKQMQKALDLLMQNKDLKNYPSSSEELSDARSQTNQIGTDLKNTTDQLSGGEKEQAGQTSARSEQGMSALHQKLQNAQTKMQKADRENISTKMEKITDNLLKLYEQEEALIERTNKLSDYSDQFPEVAKSQQQLLENMNHVEKDILDLSHETFFLPPGIGQSLGSAYGNMNRSLSELENRRQETASAFQGQSMSGLNMSVLQMQQAMQAMGEEGSALGFEQFLKKMQQLSDSQGQLNQEGMNFFNQNQGSLSIEQQSQLKRMAAEQQAIRNSMDQLGQEVNNRSDVLGDLDNLAREMEEVVKDLNALKIDRQTIERQQKILSRMLDAQKSVREQEYSKQRLAEIGQEYKKKSPDQPRNFEDLKLKQLNLDLLRALQEGYGPDYEKIIETYFKELNADLSK
jgi:DNA repair exonuclease SbcCD ATPase subunit